MSNQSQTLIIYLSPYDILRPRTNQVSDVRFCEGFAQNNCEVHLVVPTVHRRDNISIESIPNNYGLEKTFNIHFLKTRFTEDVSGKLRLMYVAFLASMTTLRLLRKNRGKNIYIISRNAPLLQFLLLYRKLIGKNRFAAKIIHWAHEYKARNSYQRIYKMCDGILATNSSILHDLCKETGIPQSHTYTTGNPITEEQVRSVQLRYESRHHTGLNYLEKPLVVYTGKIAIDYKEETTFILEAAAMLPHVQFLFTGGKPEAVHYWQEFCERKSISNIIFTGYIHDYSKVRLYQQSADILVSYYTRKGHDVRYNLPNKLCEYMLSGNLIITPDFPATRDILTGKNCLFVEPENAEALAKGINHALLHPEESNAKAVAAAQDVREITFRKKTANVLQFFSESL